MLNNVFGIDLGTNNIKIYNRADDTILVEKNMIAIENKNNVFAYGDSAFDMYEKAPSNIHISYPLSNGVIADIHNMEKIVRFFLNDLTGNSIKSADYYIAVPTDVTEVEKRAFYDLIRDANVKAKKIMVVEKAVADGLGLDIDVKNSQGVLIVNVGFDTTEISISIRAAVRKQYNLIIGGKTAENVKISLADLEKENKGAVVYGRDIVTGLPVERELPTAMIDESLIEHFYTIIDNIKVILERTPPELAADIYRHGIYLTGGASQVSHLAELIQKGTGLKVNVSENPITSVALGLSRIIKDDNLKTVAYSIEGMNK